MTRRRSRGRLRIAERYQPDSLHALRRRVRRLRYAAEIEDAVRAENSRAPALWKRLQDSIGALHDRGRSILSREGNAG